MQAQGLTLFQIVDKLKATHDVSTSTGTLSRLFKAEAVKVELFEEAKSPPVKAPPPIRTSQEWLDEFKTRDEQTRNAIAQLTSEVRMLNEKIENSGFIPEPFGKQKRRLFFSGVGVGWVSSASLLIIIGLLVVMKGFI